MSTCRALGLLVSTNVTRRSFHSSGILSVKSGPDLTKKVKNSDSFGMNLFRGKLHCDAVFPYPKTLNAEQDQELRLLVDHTAKFFEEVNNPAKNDQMGTIEENTLKHMRELGAFGLQVPQELNGLGLTNVQYARLVEIVGEHDLGIGVALGAHQAIGFKGILLYGTDEQKRKYLPKVATGEQWAAYCLTEPTSGSDADSIRSKAELSKDGKHWILNGGKIWISNGGLAEVFTVFAQTPVKDAKTGKIRDKVTAFIVERSFGGITSGPPEKKMGIKGSNTTTLSFDNVKIPVENVLGEVGQGFKVAVNILNSGRFGMSAALSGTMKYALKKSTDFAEQRIQFGKRICEYGHVQERLVRMAYLQYATESIAYHLAGSMDKGATEYQIEAAISKIFGSECAWFCVDEAIQLHGGMGFMQETQLERVLRDLRIFRIFEGANDVLRLFVVLTGMQHAGGHLSELTRAFRNPFGNWKTIANEGGKRAKRVVGMLPDDMGDATKFVPPELKKSARILNHAVDQFGASVEQLLIKHGKGILDRQLELIRLSDAAVQIYAISCVLSRVTSAIADNSPTAERERQLAELFINRSSQQVFQNLRDATGKTLVNESKVISSLSSALIKSQGPFHRHTLGF